MTIRVASIAAYCRFPPSRMSEATPSVLFERLKKVCMTATSRTLLPAPLIIAPSMDLIRMEKTTSTTKGRDQSAQRGFAVDDAQRHVDGGERNRVPCRRGEEAVSTFQVCLKETGPRAFFPDVDEKEGDDDSEHLLCEGPRVGDRCRVPEHHGEGNGRQREHGDCQPPPDRGHPPPEQALEQQPHRGLSACHAGD